MEFASGNVKREIFSYLENAGPGCLGTGCRGHGVPGSRVSGKHGVPGSLETRGVENVRSQDLWKMWGPGVSGKRRVWKTRGPGVSGKCGVPGSLENVGCGKHGSCGLWKMRGPGVSGKRGLWKTRGPGVSGKCRLPGSQGLWETLDVETWGLWKMQGLKRFLHQFLERASIYLIFFLFCILSCFVWGNKITIRPGIRQCSHIAFHSSTFTFRKHIKCRKLQFLSCRNWLVELSGVQFVCT